MRILIIILLISVSVQVDAQDLKFRKYSNEFLSLGVGARGIGMSNTNTAISDDVTSAYWNPAGLVLIKPNLQVGLMHSEHFAGIVRHDYLGIASHIDDKSVFGFTVIRAAIDDIPNTLDLFDGQGNMDLNRITTFSAADYGFLFSYARKSKIEGLNYGANAKIIRRKIGDFANSWGFGLDIGVQYIKDNWRFGFAGKDISTTFNAWSMSFTDKEKEVFSITNNVIPENSVEITQPKLLFGVARKFTIKEKFTLLPTLDFDLTTDKKRNVLISGDPISIDPHAGIEIAYKDFLYFRCGIGNIQKETTISKEELYTYQLTMGVGIIINDFICIDYALTDLGDNSIAIYSNIISIRLNINKKEKSSSPSFQASNHKLQPNKN